MKNSIKNEYKSFFFFNQAILSQKRKLFEHKIWNHAQSETRRAAKERQRKTNNSKINRNKKQIIMYTEIHSNKRTQCTHYTYIITIDKLSGWGKTLTSQA